MHTCYCHKQLQKPRVSAPLLLGGGGLCAVLCGHQKDLAGLGWAWGPPEPVGAGASCSCNCQLERREEEGGKRKPPGLLPPLKKGGRAEPSEWPRPDPAENRTEPREGKSNSHKHRREQGASSCPKTEKVDQAGWFSKRR